MKVIGKSTMLFVFLFIAFLTFSANANKKRSPSEEIEYYTSISSDWISNESKNELDRIRQSIKDNSDKYLPILKETTQVKNLKKNIENTLEYNKYTRKLSLLGVIGNEKAMLLLKKRYMEIEEWGDSIKSKVDNNTWDKKWRQIVFTKAIILKSFANNKDPLMWDHVFKGLFQEKLSTFQINILDYLCATYKNVDAKRINSAIEILNSNSEKIFNKKALAQTIAILSEQKQSKTLSLSKQKSFENSKNKPVKTKKEWKIQKDKVNSDIKKPALHKTKNNSSDREEETVKKL